MDKFLRQNQGQRIKKGYLILVLYLLFAMIMIWAYLSSHRIPLHVSMPERLDGGWNYEADESEGILCADHMVTRKMAGKTIAFYTRDSYVDAVLEGPLEKRQHIYHFGENMRFGKTPGVYYHFIELPGDALGKQLYLTIHTVYPDKYQKQYQFFSGSTSDIIMMYLLQDLVRICTNMIILIFGLVQCLLHLIGRRNGISSRKNFYMGIFSITFAVWANSAMITSQLMFQNAVFQYYMTYFSLFVLPLVFLMYAEAMNPNIKCGLEFGIMFFMITACVLLHFCNIRDFTETIKIFDIVMGCTLMLLVIRIFRYCREDNVLRASLMVLMGFCLLNVLNYVFRSSFGYPFLLAMIGLMSYMIVALYSGIRQMMQDMALIRESAVLKKIAYQDNLTNISNRYALERDLKEMDLHQVSVVSLDLNNLKKCNDNFGHICGDKFIMTASEILCRVYGQVYRTGGDEFVALLKNETRESLQAKKEKMQKLLDIHNQSADAKVKLEIASGYAWWQKGDVSCEDILKRADQEMYLDKKKLKKASGETFL